MRATFKATLALDALRATLATALGLNLAACGGETADATERDAAANAATDGAIPFACVDPVPVLVAGMDTGYDTCADGAIRRRAIVDCPSRLSPEASCQAEETPFPGMCTSNADCDAGPYAQCALNGYLCVCNYGCVRDSDCAAGQICFCGDPMGTCKSASCNAGTCDAGAECADYSLEFCPGCVAGFACQTAADQCFGDSDCAGGSCAITNTSARVCTQGNGGSCCGFGRPLVVDGVARLAQSVVRDDWQVSSAPDLTTMAAALRARLAQHWTETARMEHASVAAFARLVLQLLGLGAPHDLVADGARAMADETKHARLAFGLASAYAGTELGPGPIALDRCLDDGGVGAFVATTFVEGCVGETLAALEACEALEHARDPAVRAVLETLARDEAQHAQHAWRTAAWALATFGQSAHDAMRAEVTALDAQPSVADVPRAHAEGDSLLTYGIVTGDIRAALRRTALRTLVVPLASALLDSQNRGPRADERAVLVDNKRERAAGASVTSQPALRG